MSAITVIIVRHGDAVTADIDPQRPLSRHGVGEAERLAAALSKDGVTVSRVVHSGKARAMQTAGIVGRLIAPGVDPFQANGLNPDDDPSQVISALRAEPASILVAGHMPSVGRITLGLIPNAPPTVANFWTGSAVRLTRHAEEDWELEKIYDSRDL